MELYLSIYLGIVPQQQQNPKTSWQKSFRRKTSTTAQFSTR